MECSRCGAHNETEVGSCLSCGAPLRDDESPTASNKPVSRVSSPRLNVSPPKQCPNCMTLNAATFKFCARCGTSLGGAPRESKPATGPIAAPKAAPAKPAAPAPAAAAPAAPAPAPAAKSAAANPTRPPPPSAAKPAAPAKPAAGARPAPPPPPKPVTGVTRPPAPALKPAPARPRARLSAIARDGSRSADFVLIKDETRLGREVGEGEIKLDTDPFIAPLHAVFKFEGTQLVVHDAGSPNGVFIWLKERKLAAGDELRVGRQRLRIEWLPNEPEALADQPLWGSPDPGYAARAVQMLEGGGDGDIYPLKTGDNLVGRGTGDVSFPGDGYVSSRHAMLTVGDGALSVKDMGSANGTFVRVSGSARIDAGDLLLVGEQILRVDPA